jgi:hypothetical protein
VSGTKELSPATDPAPPATTPETRRRRSGRRRARTAILVTAVALVAVAGSFSVTRAVHHTPSPTAPLILPQKVQTLERLPVDGDPTRLTRWQQKATAAARGTTLAAQGYGEGARTLRAVAARTDLSGSVDLTWAVDQGQVVGKNRCTQNVRLVPNGAAGVRPTLALCWRTTPSLSAYTLLIDPKKSVSVQEGSAALDDVWSAITEG